MKIGMTLPTMVPELNRSLLLAWMRGIDQGPFSTLAAGERIAFPNQEMMVTMAAAAAVTERVRLAFTLVVLPAGRVTVGIGVGGREEDYRAVGAPFTKRLGRMEEQVALLRRVWSGE